MQVHCRLRRLGCPAGSVVYTAQLTIDHFACTVSGSATFLNKTVTAVHDAAVYNATLIVHVVFGVAAATIVTLTSTNTVVAAVDNAAIPEIVIATNVNLSCNRSHCSHHHQNQAQGEAFVGTASVPVDICSKDVPASQTTWKAEVSAVIHSRLKREQQSTTAFIHLKLKKTQFSTVFIQLR
jgi:hypothetical protein